MSSAAIKTLRGNGKAKASKPSALRVAAYARVSVADRDQSALTSIQAQKDAIVAYIASQAVQGWELVGEPYSDDGFSGATTKRPALERLLQDVSGGEIDAVVVHRFDRLSRSQRDFLNIIHFLGEHGTAFVSVTQSLDTGTPMGRCMMGVITSFAQMERELIGERTSDKMSAARKKGLWTGGRPVLGYDVIEKRLEINVAEADRVREIFTLYLKLRSLISVVNELDARGWRGKQWTTKSGEVAGGNPISKSTLITLLRNPLYIGMTKAGDALCEGQHEAIIEQGTWDAAQAMLSRNRNCESPRRRRDHKAGDALLQGLVKCACGAALTPHYTKAGAKKYCFYVCTLQQREGAKACPGSRVASGKLESFVIEQLRAIGREPAVLEATLGAEGGQRAASVEALKAKQAEASAESKRLEIEKAGLAKLIDGNGSVTPGIKETLADVECQLEKATARAQDCNAELTSLQGAAVDPLALQEALADFEPIWNELFPREKARVLALLIESIEFNAAEGVVSITYRPGGPEQLKAEAEGAAQ